MRVERLRCAAQGEAEGLTHEPSSAGGGTDAEPRGSAPLGAAATPVTLGEVTVDAEGIERNWMGAPATGHPCEICGRMIYGDNVRKIDGRYAHQMHYLTGG